MDQNGQEIPQRFEEDMIEIDLREYLELLWRRKWIIISLVVLAVIASYFISQQMTRIYQTSTMVMVKEDSGMEDVFSDQFSAFTGGSRNKVATYTEMLKSRRILSKVIKNLNLRSKETDEYISTGSLRESISVSPAGDTNLVNITVTYPDPVVARDIANELVTVFKAENQELNRADLHNASKFISEQVASVQASLADLEEKLINYKKANGVVFPEEHGKQLLEKITELETARAEANINLQQAKLSLEKYREELSREDKEIVSSRTITNNPEITKNQQRLTELEIQLAGLLEVYTEKHPKVIEVKKKIAEIKDMMAGQVDEIISARQETINPVYQSLKQKIITLQTTVLSAEAQIATYDHQIAELEKELNKLPSKELALARLQREKKVAESVYLLLMERREELRIQEAMKSSDLVVVDPAVVREDPIKPKVKLNVVIAAFLAIFIGVFIIFLLEYLDNTVKEEKDIERLTGLPVLGVVPEFDSIDHSRGYGRNDA